MVAPAASAVAAVLGLGALARRLGAAAVMVAALCGGIGWARACWVLAEFDRQHEAARELLSAPGRCAASGRVISSPALIGGSLRFDAELGSLDCGGALDARSWPTRLYVPVGAAGAPGSSVSELARGDEFSVIADLAPVSEFRNLDVPDPRPGSARRAVVLSGAALALEVEHRAGGVTARIDRARAHVRGRILATFGDPVVGMARALVLGENDLTPEDERAFQQSGLSHLLAVSGTHLILAVLALVRCGEALLRRWEWLARRRDVRRPVAWFGACLAPLYADFAGGSGSAWRAAYMLCAVLGVRALGRHVFSSRVLAASLALGWVADGLVAFDTSFLLSIAATTGLLAMGRRLEDDVPDAGTLPRPRRPELARAVRRVSQAALTTLGATLPCLPILLSISPGLSLASVAANLLAAPLGEALALPLCLLHALCFPLPALERGVALVASGALALIRAVARTSASIDWLYFEVPPPTAWHIACLATGITLYLAVAARSWLGDTPAPRRAGARAWAVAVICASSLLAIEAVTRSEHSAAHGRALHRLRITALDVGQGDATLIDLPDGRLMLIDGGGFVGVPIDPGERVILPTLRARRRDRIDIVVLTHPHPDHYGGLLSVLSQVSVGEFWYGGADAGPAEGTGPTQPSLERGAPAYRRLLELARSRGIVMKDARALCAGQTGDTAVQVLHPCPGVAPEHEANDNSLVVRITQGRHAALLVGDAERWAEQHLLASPAVDLRADFLKVGHHGSRTSSGPEFLARVAPRFASISCGIRNRFGHPHPEALAHLQEVGAQVLRLDRVGAVRWQSDGVEQSASTFLDGELDGYATTRRAPGSRSGYPPAARGRTRAAAPRAVRPATGARAAR